jgi:hypothetical protein
MLNSNSTGICNIIIKSSASRDCANKGYNFVCSLHDGGANNWSDHQLEVSTYKHFSNNNNCSFFHRRASEYSKIIFAERETTPAIFLMLGMNFQTACLFLIISRIRWIFNFFSMTSLQIYIWIRALYYENNHDLQIPVFITLMLFLIIYLISAMQGSGKTIEFLQAWKNFKNIKRDLKILSET